MRQIRRDTRLRSHLRVMYVFKVLASTGCQYLVDFVPINPAICADQMSKDRGVVSASHANLHYRLALLDLADPQPKGVCAGYPDIEFAFAIQCKEQVLVEKYGIVVGRLYVCAGH